MDNTSIVQEKKKLPARKIVLIVIMSIIMAATLAFWAYITIFSVLNGNNTEKMALFIIVMPMYVFVPVLLGEGSIFFDIFYLLSDKSKKEKYKTILNTITLILAAPVVLLLFVGFPSIMSGTYVVMGIFYLLLLINVTAIAIIKIVYLILHSTGKNKKKEAPVA